MADPIAIGYPDRTTAGAAATQAQRLVRDLIIQPAAIALIVREMLKPGTSCLFTVGSHRGGAVGFRPPSV
jgi:hypothetical protein